MPPLFDVTECPGYDFEKSNLWKVFRRKDQKIGKYIIEKASFFSFTLSAIGIKSDYMSMATSLWDCCRYIPNYRSINFSYSGFSIRPLILIVLVVLVHAYGVIFCVHPFICTGPKKRHYNSPFNQVAKLIVFDIASTFVTAKHPNKHFYNPCKFCFQVNRYNFTLLKRNYNVGSK
jgi:hypothetical protein